MGNNDIPYYFAVTKKNQIFLFLENVIFSLENVPKELRIKYNSPYWIYYELERPKKCLWERIVWFVYRANWGKDKKEEETSMYNGPPNIPRLRIQYTKSLYPD